MTDAPIRLGIISAMQEEQAGLIEAMGQPAIVTHAMRDYASGRCGNLDCVLVLSRMGKVAAAATAASLIERFGVTHVLFTGVAGGADATVAIGDVVVAQALVQHDMDASPLFPRFEVPLLGRSHFAPDDTLTDRLAAAAAGFLAQDLAQAIDAEDRSRFRLRQPKLHRGLIASGDMFIADRAHLARLKTALPAALAVEMEGAAVAQVCYEFGVPFAVMRTISDDANEESPIDFMRFIERVAARYAFGIVRRLCASAL